MVLRPSFFVTETFNHPVAKKLGRSSICRMRPLRRVVYRPRIRIRTFDSRCPRLGRLIFSLHSNPVSVRLVRVRSSATRRPYGYSRIHLCRGELTLTASAAQLDHGSAAPRNSVYLFVDFTSVSFS